MTTYAEFRENQARARHPVCDSFETNEPPQDGYEKCTRCLWSKRAHEPEPDSLTLRPSDLPESGRWIKVPDRPATSGNRKARRAEAARRRRVK